jgi:ectoine hydroxylase-related dioxygenase (phytanoyl-CoA dioxygenase family)
MKTNDFKVVITNLKIEGHCCINQALPIEELYAIEKEIKRLMKTKKMCESANAAMEQNVVSYGQGWTFRENLWRHSVRLKNYFLTGTLAQLAQKIFSTYEDNQYQVGLLRDQTYFKKPGSEFTPWHQDGTFIPLPNISSITFWIPFHHILDNMSPMFYVDKSHKCCWLDIGGSGHPDSVFVKDFEASLNTLRKEGYQITTYHNLNPGDVLVHDSWTLHGSPTHTGHKPRFAIVVVYYIVHGRVELVPEIRLLNKSDSAQARRLRQLNLDDLFPDMNNVVLIGSNPRTPTLIRKNQPIIFDIAK